jgi:polyisoprenyl-phosphate glycosyltransferase
VEALRLFGESNIYLRGIIAYSGFRQCGVPYDRRPRYRGESKFSYWGYFRFAWNGITSFSHKPLLLAAWAGTGLAGLSFLGAIFYLCLQLFVGTRLPGFTTLVLLQLFLAGVQLLSIGLIGSYLGRVFNEVKARPRSIVESELASGEKILGPTQEKAHVARKP